MKKIIIMMVLLFFILLSISIEKEIFSKLLVKNANKDFDYSWTKAICEKNKCQDYEIKCLKGEILEMKPITSLIIFNEDWMDVRKQKEKDKLC